MKSLDNALYKALARIVGKEYVLSLPEELIAYSYDAVAPARDQLPAAIVIPKNRDEISDLLKLANRLSFPVIPRGSATGLCGGARPAPDSVVVLFNRMNRIREIDSANMTALVEPGVLTGKFIEVVEKEGLFYPPDPSSMSISTMGGNVATNAGGLRGLKYGVTGDYVMGLEVVLPTGEVMHTGARCKKDVAGYDLTSLFIGSEGTLGIITEILIRLLPLPQASRTALAFFRNEGNAARVVADIIAARIIPVTLEFMDNLSLRCVEEYAHLGLLLDANAMLLIEVDGQENSLDGQMEQIVTICKQNNANSITVARDDKEAYQLKTARRTTLAALARRRPTTILEDVTVPRSNVPVMVERIRQIANRYNVEIAIFGHAGDGNLHPTGMTDARDKVELARVEAAFDEIFAAALELGGTITGEHGVGVKKRHFLPKQTGDIGIRTMAAFKRTLDPNQVLNPGKVLAL